VSQPEIPLIGLVANAFASPWVSLFVTPAVLAGVALPMPFDAYAFRAAHALLELLAAGLQTLSGPSWALWRLPQPNASGRNCRPTAYLYWMRW
jgi:competence protein ComEC